MTYSPAILYGDGFLPLTLVSTEECIFVFL
jgi:hypothetical protein